MWDKGKSMRSQNGIFRGITRVTWVAAAVGMAGLVFLSCAVVADVFMRYVFNAPITGVRDLLSLFIAVTMGLMMPVLLLKEGNISVHFIEIVVGKRIGAVLVLIGNILTASIFLLIAFELYKAARYLGSNNEVTQVLGVPLEPWWLLVSASFAFSAIAALVPICRNIRSVMHPEEEQGGGEK